MTFAIVAEPLLGVYKGHVGSGEPDSLPSPARLHAALLCAAAQGIRAVAEGDKLRPCDADREALRWLEKHPPDGIVVPATLRIDSDATAYRKDGVIVKEGRSPLQEKLIGKAAVDGVAVRGRFAWTWQQRPPEPVVAALTELCPEVPYLGTSESPVRLSVAEAEPTHLLDREADLFTGSGLDLTVATAGRADALEAAHQVATVPPAMKADAHRSSERTTPPPVVTAGVVTGRYAEPAPPVPVTPWTSVLRLPLGQEVPPEQRVRWAVAVHRALISHVGDGAPAVLTGVYADGAPRPCNRCAIQFVGGSTLALLLPQDTTDVEFAMIGAAVSRLRHVTSSYGRLGVAGAPELVPADQFWPAPAAGTVRWWRTDPVAIPDSRPPRGGRWSLADAVAMSVGMVWRYEIPVSGRGDTRYRALAAGAVTRGVQVHSAMRVMDGDVGRYVHKINPDALIQPYRATLSLGNLAGPRTIAAIGQTRHLGGGLLVPVDVPVENARRLAR
ncbi:type I-U CRISPR-associated protein Cas5/Cas6 [Dactylosporangium aurantiacum]|uniref:Type I-U CRISPR-associated protein Cas5/Cas6 n=1 Tax=Dactylosporangium aurantiacum TaxID=35754 RepID=A0A9Q9IGZ9_9ACTN|nr:type I-U CRISPR-associated protein Csb2 [Dactylosporangium aurantiacum]MDG6100495.1 type I-U CRISPR-associated protein Csb2 [Dactylosporangium aurantiacum]UWZ55401.1 type I-U CRISPR-associated protein Cas5/Cas6 [Dactylosporangium aurantiacum]